MAHPSANARNLLLLSAGSKVAIARIAKEAAHSRGIELHISDTSEQIPSYCVADHFSTLPPAQHPDWKTQLIQLCQKAKIGLIIPTRHNELPALSLLRPELEAIGTQLSLSDSQTLDICFDKLQTYKFLQKVNIPTPKSCLLQDFNGQFQFPLIAKPANGSSSKGITIAQTDKDLDSVPAKWILQEKAEGTEYTTNLYLNASSEVLCAIPHQRITVESGEVVQAKTKRLSPIVKLCTKAAQALPGARGIINIQAFFDEKTKNGKIIEINPRIGGGYPLCHTAKGHYLEWLLREHLDQQKVLPFSDWTENLLMMRYRDAFFSL